MLFRLLALKLHNFKAYYGDHEWVLPEGNGLFYITGRNKFNARLGANGIGKSTLVDAINWVIYGKTSRGLKAMDVVAWNKSSASATVTFQFGDERKSITRSQRPNKILIDDSPANQDEVDKLIRLNQKAFNNSMIIPQFGESFLDLGPTEKLAVFSKIMDLDYWLTKSKVADEQTDRILGEIHEHEKRISRAEGNIEHLEKAIADHHRRQASFAKNHKRELRECRHFIRAASINVEKLKADFDKASEAVAISEKKRSELTNDVDKLRQLVASKQKRVTELETMIRGNQRRQKDHDDELLSIEDRKGTVCPTCQQKVDKNHVKKHQLLVLEKSDKLQKEIDGWVADLEKSQAVVSKAEGEYREYRDRYSEIDRSHFKLVDSANSIRNAISNLQLDIRSHNDKLRGLEKANDPYEDLIRRDLEEKKSQKRRIRKARVKLDELRTLHDATAYWVKGFKRVRLFVIEDALANLEIEVNNLLVTLGLLDWKITFDIERENKSGGVTKGFTVLIHSPKHDKPVKFESFSGGEVQRLRNAADLGLSNLIMESVGFENAVEIIDEPSEHLSAEGIEDLIESLAQRATDNQKQIWLVEHHSLASNLFEGTLRINMNKKGQASIAYD